MKLKHTLLTLCLALCAAGSAEASLTIDWGSDPFGTFLESDGTSLFNTNYFAELGSFAPGFSPTAANITSWSSNWVSAQQLNVNTGTGNGINLSSSYITGTVGLSDTNVSSSTGNLFAGGTQMYMWVYEGSKTYGPGMEWAVVTNPSWTVTAPTANPLNTGYRMTDAGTVAIFGGVNGVSGAGDHATANLPAQAYVGTGDFDGFTDETPNTFEIQTHTVNASPVPEPGSAMLVGAVGVLGLLRRRRTLAA
jgi:hypothetical protein